MLRPRVFAEKLPFIPAHIYMRVALSLRAYKYARGAKRVKQLLFYVYVVINVFIDHC